MPYSNDPTSMSQTKTIPHCSTLATYHPIHYPSEVKNELQRREFKQKLLEGNPETLFADLYKNGEVSNLIFYSEHPSIWHSTIIHHHPSAERKGICNGWKLQLTEKEDPDTVITTINIYKTGKIMVQGNIKTFQSEFETIKAQAAAQREKSGPLDPPQTTSAATSPPHSSLTEEEQSDKEMEPTASTAPPMNDMRDKLAHMERELVQLHEMSLQTNTLKDSNIAIYQQLSTTRTLYEHTQHQIKELQLDRDTSRKELAMLKEILIQIQQERSDNKKEISSMSEKLREREVTINSLSEQLQVLTNQSPHLTSTLVASPDLQQPPEPQIDLSPPRKQQHPPEQASPPTKQHKWDIVLLIDSNGKFLDEKRLFPNHSTIKIGCPTTNRALDLLSEEHLGSPGHIIIHTGTNDLRDQQERVATSLKAVINKASNTFPNTKIVMSTLLPRKDFHPKTISGINASMSRDCALRPNVYLAHHPTLEINGLFDQVHLKKERVSVFARTLKDAALGRIPRSDRQNGRGESRAQASPSGAQGPALQRQERRAPPKPPHHYPQHRSPLHHSQHHCSPQHRSLQHQPLQHLGHGTAGESTEHHQGTPGYPPPLHPRPLPTSPWSPTPSQECHCEHSRTTTNMAARPPLSTTITAAQGANTWEKLC